MIKVGLTGGIGSGKSYVCRVFSELGVAVYDTDSRAKELMVANESIVSAVIAAFGPDSYQDGVLNRGYLASIVFGDSDKLALLNDIVHPVVREDFLRWADMQYSKYVIVECAILFETGLDRLVDKIIEVTAPLAVRMERVCRRDGVSEEAVMARMRAQKVVPRRDYSVTTDGSIPVLDQVIKIDEEIRTIGGQ